MESLHKFYLKNGIRLFVILIFLSSLLQARIPIPKDLFYLNELPLAQKRAEKLDLPIVFIVALPAFLDADDEQSNAISPNPAGATHYAFQTFQERGILVWINAESEQKNLPPVVEQSLYDTGISFFYPPKILITTPNLDRAIAVVNMTDNIEERQRWSLSALEKMENKTEWKAPLPSPQDAPSPETPAPPATPTPPWVYFLLGLILGSILIYILLTIRRNR
ncbi:MAG: hypothetical protein V4507_11165 [Verrucomicrobiota bacterium]